MAFDITSIAQVYQAEDLNFSTDEERGIIRFSMNTQASPDVRFTARVVNPRTALFTTILPMNIPEKNPGELHAAARQFPDGSDRRRAELQGGRRV